MRLPEQKHGDARLDQRGHQHGDPFLRALPDLPGMLHAGIQRPLGDQRRLFIVRLSRRQTGELPVEQGGIFAEHISESGGNERLRRLHQDIQIGEDGGRRHGWNRLLDSADDERSPGRRKPVHRRRCRHRDERNAASMPGKPDDIVDRSGTRCDQRIRQSRFDRQQQLYDCRLVRDHVAGPGRLKQTERYFQAGLPEHELQIPAGCFIRIPVRGKYQPFASVLHKKRRHLVQRSGLQDKTFKKGNSLIFDIACSSHSYVLSSSAM